MASDAEIRRRLYELHIKQKKLEGLTRKHYELQERSQSVSSRRYSVPLRHSGYSHETPQIRAMYQAYELEPAIVKAMDEIQAMRRDIASIIERIQNPRYRKVLACVFLDFLSLQQTADLMHISYNAAECLLRRAVRYFGKTLDNDG